MNKQTIPTLVFFMLTCALLLTACTKENGNERKLAGLWKAKEVTFTKYKNNQVVSDSTATLTGELQLQNSNGTDNYAYTVDLNLFPTSYCNWDVSSDKINQISFYLLEPGVTNFHIPYTIEKATHRKLVLTSYISDDSLNVDQKTTLVFIRK